MCNDVVRECHENLILGLFTLARPMFGHGLYKYRSFSFTLKLNVENGCSYCIFHFGRKTKITVGYADSRNSTAQSSSDQMAAVELSSFDVNVT